MTDAITERYHALADPLKVIRIDPADIRYATVNPSGFAAGRSLDPWQDLGRIVGGDWDTPAKLFPFAKSVLTRSLEQHYIHGVPFGETRLIKRKVREAKQLGRPVDGCSTRAEFLARYEELDRVYESMVSDGYVMQGDLDPERWQDDILVAIGRDGELFFVRGQGTHRLALARLVLPEIPVRVLFRHELWQEVRESGPHCDHPDLEDVRTS
jgi:hypothetical protein